MTNKKSLSYEEKALIILESLDQSNGKLKDVFFERIIAGLQFIEVIEDIRNSEDLPF